MWAWDNTPVLSTLRFSQAMWNCQIFNFGCVCGGGGLPTKTFHMVHCDINNTNKHGRHGSAFLESQYWGG